MAKGSAIMKPVPLSKELAEFVGQAEMGRGDIVKKIWDYIKSKNLQNPDNKREILCDETLKNLFGAKTINMFKIAGAISKHIK
jgi:upstream activation factor subunit UAF30